MVRLLPKNNKKLPQLRTQNLVITELEEESLIYDLDVNKAFCLNETARLVMNQCDGTKSVDQALGIINRQLKTKMSADMVWLVVSQLKDANFIEKDYEIPIQTNRVSRRKILNAAASLGVALPIITSLIVPTALHAQSSCLTQNQMCGSGLGVCCPNLNCISVGPSNFQCIPACITEGNLCSGLLTFCCPGLICSGGLLTPPSAFTCMSGLP